MNILSTFRRKLFWSIDLIKGNPVKTHYEEINLINEQYTSEKASELRLNNLEKILNHAANTTPFYSNLKGVSDLEKFPVINKNIVRNNYEDFKSSLHRNKKNTIVATGGSTGMPFKLFHDKNKRNRHTADNIYYAQEGGYNLGDRLYLLRAWHKKGSNASLMFIKKNVRPYAIVNYTDNDMEKLLSDLKNDSSEKCIVCFASMCDILVNHLDSTNKNPLSGLKIKSIITDGDSLSKTTKEKMENYFQTATVARYGNMENGIMGQQSYKGGHDYELNWASYYYELLGLTSDEPAKPGELGRIVVTDLFNECMPLIRYDTGDLASFSINNTTLYENGKFERIEGRKVDLIYNTSGEVISPYIVVQKMLLYEELKQFQFVQLSSIKYVFKLNPWNKFTQEKELINDSKSYLGNDAEISIEYVEEVPLLSSGKRKQVLNQMDN